MYVYVLIYVDQSQHCSRSDLRADLRRSVPVDQSYVLIYVDQHVDQIYWD